MDVFNVLLSHTEIIVLIFARITGLLVVAPFFNSRTLPMPLKTGFAVILALLISPVVPQPAVAVPQSPFAYTIVMFGEFAVGLMIGFIFNSLFLAIQLAGQLIDTQIGFGMVNVFDLNFGAQVPLVGNFKYLLALLIFMLINGHHLMLMALTDSYQIVPLLGANFFAQPLFDHFLNIVSNLFIIGFKFSAPVVGSLFLTDVVLGILARTVPQMNVFFVGMPLKIAVGFVIMFLSLSLYTDLVQAFFNDTLQDVYKLLRILHG